ncbi:MAG: STAS domain-containing protein [Pseudonocardiaceae bacterium]
MWQTIDHDDGGQLAWCDVVIPTDTSRVRVLGELDLHTAPRLERLLDQLRCDGHRQITLDLSGLEFLSAAGLSVFLHTDQELHAVGGRLVLTQPTRTTRRILAITELDTTLNIHPTPPDRDRVPVREHANSGDAR